MQVKVASSFSAVFMREHTETSLGLLWAHADETFNNLPDSKV